MVFIKLVGSGSSGLGLLLYIFFVPIFGAVGFLFALYFLFKAADNVRDTDSKIDRDKRVEELKSQIDLLKKELNK